jgi:hypothetical protein
MHIPRPIAVAALTAVTVGSVAHAVLPSSQDQTDPVKVQKELQREYGANRKRELENASLQAGREADAINADELRAAEVRPAEKEATAVARALFKEP